MADVFDGDLFDLSEYSDRVIGIGAPVYRVARSMTEDAGSGEHRFEAAGQTSGEEVPMRRRMTRPPRH